MRARELTLGNPGFLSASFIPTKQRQLPPNTESARDWAVTNGAAAPGDGIGQLEQSQKGALIPCSARRPRQNSMSSTVAFRTETKANKCVKI